MFVGVVFLLPASSFGIPIPVPAGLSPGDTYHLVFVTSTTRDATSTNIDDYNDFVQAAANAAGLGDTVGITWKAIGSTATVDARDNALVSAPVYRLDGELVATGYDDMWDYVVGPGWDGSILSPISLTEQGTYLWTLVWTGSYPTGRKTMGLASIYTLGMDKPLFGIADPTYTGADPTERYFKWDWITRSFTISAAASHSFYALSEPLSVPIPEPSTIVLMTCGLLVLLGICVKRRRKAK